MAHAEVQTVEVSGIPYTEFRYQHSNSQTQAPQVWDKPTASAQIGDVIRVPFAPVMLVVNRDILSDEQVWLLLKPTTGSTTEEWVLQPEPNGSTQQPAPEPEPQQLFGFAGDSVACQLQPTTEATTEFEQARHHGQQDASARLHPIYSAPSNAYAAGYLEGYQSVLNPTTHLAQVSPPAQTWSVSYDPKWKWYQAWVGNCYLGSATTFQQAERLAQQYIAINEIIQRQNRVVLKAY